MTEADIDKAIEETDEMKQQWAKHIEQGASMTDLRKAAELALYALEFNYPLIEDYGNKEQLDIHHEAIMALYKSLAQPEQEHKPWVGLTDEEIKGILDCRRGGLVDIKKAEQFLKDKNT